MAPILMSCTGNDLVRIISSRTITTLDGHHPTLYTIEHKLSTRDHNHRSRLDLKPTWSGGITQVYPISAVQGVRTLFTRPLLPASQGSSSVPQTGHAASSGTFTTGGVPSQAAMQPSADGAGHVRQVHSSGHVNQTGQVPAHGAAKLYPIVTSSISPDDQRKLFKYFEVSPLVYICYNGAQLTFISRA